MSIKRIILISGYARSGKDSLANALTKELAHLEPVRVKFADVLKTTLSVSLQRLALDVDVFTEDNAAKQAIRPLLVEFGKFARSVDRDVFVRAAWKDICDLFENGKTVIIVPDLRYVNEFNLISEWAEMQCWVVTHLRIGRMGNHAANDEELQSISALPQADAVRIFAEGDLAGIDAWAKELCRQPSLPMPDWLKEGQTSPKLTSSFHGPNGEPIFIEHLVPHADPIAQLSQRMISLGVTLERMDARLKKLEADRHDF
jgi:hypothetical protein